MRRYSSNVIVDECTGSKKTFAALATKKLRKKSCVWYQRTIDHDKGKVGRSDSSGL